MVEDYSTKFLFGVVEGILDTISAVRQVCENYLAKKKVSVSASIATFSGI